MTEGGVLSEELPPGFSLTNANFLKQRQYSFAAASNGAAMSDAADLNYFAAVLAERCTWLGHFMTGA